MSHSRKLIAPKLYRTLVATALITNGIFQLVVPALAEGTAAGQPISNTATATYQDDNNTTINATSNTVTVTIAEVAGITISADGVAEAPTVAEGGTPSSPIVAGDKVYYNFTIKNVGNDPTKFHIPAKDKVSITGAATVDKLQYQKADTTWADFAAAGEDTASIPADGSIKVRVVVTVGSSAVENNLIKVRLGNTGATINGQNTTRDVDDDDVYTVDNADNSGVPGEITGSPINGTVEASREETATVGVSPTATLLNGPQGKPDAIGATTDPNDARYRNDDFTNKSANVPAGIKPDSNQKIPTPTAVTFTGTVKNTTANATNISLLPTPPDTLSDLPNGTKVTITYGGVSKEYTWNGTAFQFAGRSINQNTDYITISNVAANTSVDYTASVLLPANSPLSTDLNGSNNPIGGFPVPITAFVDDATPGFNGEAAKNTTIDRVYTGFLRMVKMSRIVQGDGPAVTGSDGTFSTGAKTPAPGNIIEYQITYTNISQAQPTGGTSVILNANNVTITEDGTLSTVAGDGKNNWAKDNDSDGKMDTSHVPGSASDPSGTIVYTKVSGSGTNADPDITQYVDTVTQLAPGNGTFTFQRKVYKPVAP